MAKKFRASVSQDFTIMDGDEVFGTLRVRPSAILWKPKGSRKFYSISIEKFGDYMRENGTLKKQ